MRRFVISESLLWLLYAALFSVLAFRAVQDSISLGYPPIFIGADAVCYCCAVFGIVAYALRSRNAGLRRLWGKIFPVLIAVLIAGIVMDAVLPSDYSLATAGLAWVWNSVFVILLVTPGYFANWKLAYDNS